MESRYLKYIAELELTESCMLLGMSGWMDGGEVSTGSVGYLVEKLNAHRFAEIDPADFYIYSVPGPMEISSLFRPRATIEEGLVTGLEEPENLFYAAEDANIILFRGKEPNLKWREYADCLFSVASRHGVKSICFVGSISGFVPHTRESVFYSSVTDEILREKVRDIGLNPTTYSGPSSFASYLVTRAREAGISMATVIAGMPSYVPGKNAQCVESALEKVIQLLDISVNMDDLRAESRKFRRGMDRMVNERADLSEHVRKLEEAYDEQISDVKHDRMRDWFDKQDIRPN